MIIEWAPLWVLELLPDSPYFTPFVHGVLARRVGGPRNVGLLTWPKAQAVQASLEAPFLAEQAHGGAPQGLHGSAL